MQDNLVIMGVNAPRIHQAIITKLIYGLTSLFKNKQSDLFPYPETMVDESQTSPAPDVLLVDTKTDLIKAIIEVTHTQGVKKDAAKMRGLMRDYEIPEGFVYDYKLGVWHKYELPNPEAEDSNTSYCKAVDRNLDDMLF